LNCRAPLSQRISQTADTDERAAYRILLSVVEEPFRVLLANAGYDPGEVMARIDHRGAQYGFDVRTGQVADMAEIGICDITSTQKDAVRSAVSSAGLALTVDVLVYHKHPEQVFQP
jgi:chaperonin GroEL